VTKGNSIFLENVKVKPNESGKWKTDGVLPSDKLPGVAEEEWD